jgi:hypothetical protein
VNEYVCTSTPTTIIQIASFNAGGDRRADRPHLRQLPSSYQVTLGGLGKAAATQRWQVNPRGDMREWSQPPPTRVCKPRRTPPPRTDSDSECGNDP